jgi:Fe2+ transport system protein FeoA
VSDTPLSAGANEGCQHPFICPLSKVRVGTDCRIRQLSASPEIAQRLRELGFCEEQRIKLLSQHANVICQVCNVRLGISAELAEAIWVEPLPDRELVA